MFLDSEPFTIYFINEEDQFSFKEFLVYFSSSCTNFGFLHILNLEESGKFSTDHHYQDGNDSFSGQRELDQFVDDLNCVSEMFTLVIPSSLFLLPSSSSSHHQQVASKQETGGINEMVDDNFDLGNINWGKFCFDHGLVFHSTLSFEDCLNDLAKMIKRQNEIQKQQLSCFRLLKPNNSSQIIELITLEGSDDLKRSELLQQSDEKNSKIQQKKNVISASEEREQNVWYCLGDTFSDYEIYQILRLFPPFTLLLTRNPSNLNLVISINIELEQQIEEEKERRTTIWKENSNKNQRRSSVSKSTSSFLSTGTFIDDWMPSELEVESAYQSVVQTFIGTSSSSQHSSKSKMFSHLHQSTTAIEERINIHSFELISSSSSLSCEIEFEGICVQVGPHPSLKSFLDELCNHVLDLNGILTFEKMRKRSIRNQENTKRKMENIDFSSEDSIRSFVGYTSLDYFLSGTWLNFISK